MTKTAKRVWLNEDREIYDEATGETIARVRTDQADTDLMTAAPQLLAEAVELLRNAVYEDGEARVLTQDCEALQAAIAAAKGE